MTTTDGWIAGNKQGSVYLHQTLRWQLCYLDGAPVAPGWYLFGFGIDRVCLVCPAGNIPALGLLLASRTADIVIDAVMALRHPGVPGPTASQNPPL